MKLLILKKLKKEKKLINDVKLRETFFSVLSIDNNLRQYSNDRTKKPRPCTQLKPFFRFIRRYDIKSIFIY